MLRLALSVCMVLALSVSGAVAENRVALVIGNSAYQNASALPNPRNDAEAMAAKLSSIGFQVFLRQDLDGQGFRIALGEFSEASLNADIAVFFYAGHGIEMQGQNYLIPVDAKMRSEATAQFEAVPLEQVLSAVRSAKKLGMVMLDACRDNPFAATMSRSNGTRSISRGLAPVSVEGEKGLLISFAAEAGRTADDGDAAHSPYTEALLETIDQPGLEIGRIFRTVRAKVRDLSDGRQVPIEQAQLPDEDIFLVSADASPTPTAPRVTPAPQEDPLLVYLDAVGRQDRAALEDFVRRYPTHERAKDARSLIVAMAEKSGWDDAQALNTEAGYRNFLAAFPDSPHADKAQTELIALAPKPEPQPVPKVPRMTANGCSYPDGPASVVGIKENDTLFLRAGPASSFNQIGALAYNSDGISLLDCAGGWCQVQQGCLSGYAFQEYLSSQPQGARPSRHSGMYDVTNHPASEFLNVRAGPGLNFEIVSGLPYNATGLEVIDCQRNAKEAYFWCYIRWNDISGWTYSRYLTRVQ